MIISLYTRGTPSRADHQFIGPEAEFWWLGTLGYWLQTGRPAVLARRVGVTSEVVLCGLPTSRKVEDGSPISNLAVLTAQVGSDDAALAARLGADWLDAIAASDLRGQIPSTFDDVVDAEFVSTALGEDTSQTNERLEVLAQQLRDGIETGAVGEVEPVRGKLVTSLESEEGRAFFRRYLESMAMTLGSESDDLDATAAFLNMAGDQSDAEQARQRQGGGSLLVVPGRRPIEVVKFEPPKEQAIDQEQHLIDRLQKRTLLIVLTVTVLAMFIVTVLALSS